MKVHGLQRANVNIETADPSNCIQFFGLTELGKPVFSSYCSKKQQLIEMVQLPLFASTPKAICLIKPMKSY